MTTALVRVPEASHGIAARPSHLIAKVDNILAWFEKYRKKNNNNVGFAKRYRQSVTETFPTQTFTVKKN